MYKLRATLRKTAECACIHHDLSQTQSILRHYKQLIIYKVLAACSQTFRPTAVPNHYCHLSRWLTFTTHAYVIPGSGVGPQISTKASTQHWTGLQTGAVKLGLWRHWMHVTQVHQMTAENQFHCTRLYRTLSRFNYSTPVSSNCTGI